jgi:4'-phosphopantetheinyl transferase
MTPRTNSDWAVWHSLPNEPIQDKSVVQAWCCDLDDPDLAAFCDESILPDQERQLAARLRSPRRQGLFRRRRALSRFLLGRFLGVPPWQLVFAEGLHGEPTLVQPMFNSCRFSLSHSEGLFAMAISDRFQVGVDVEVARAGWNWGEIAELYLDDGRLARFNRLEAPEREETFLRFWCLHEAFAKATGLGIACESEERVAPEEVWGLVCPGEASVATLRAAGWRWALRRLPVGGSEAAAALVARGTAAT